MDKLKEILKSKLGKSVNISISVGPSKEEQQTSDMAPTVKDSDEPGVVKDDLKKEADHENPLEHEAQGSPLMQSDDLEKLMQKTPKGGFHDGAREKMKQRLMGLKKG